MPDDEKNVAVIGATPKPDRYAFRAMKMLREHGYHAIPINPAHSEILGQKCFPRLRDIDQKIDTITLYLREAHSTPLMAEIIEAKPRRIIMNPGAENDALAEKAGQRGIEVVANCTLVMLGSGTF